VSAPWPIPFPRVLLPPFDFDFAAFFGQVQLSIRNSRRYRNQPPLVPNESLNIGQEHSADALSPPTIVVVPEGYSYRPARHDRDRLSPQLQWSAWLSMRVECWGPEDPEGSDPLYSFSSTAELARQFLNGLIYAQKESRDSVQVEGSEWVQNVNLNRLGRKLVLRVSVQTYVAKDPPIFVPFQTPTTPGAVVDIVADLATPAAQSPASTLTEASFTVP
jgi:hypothetical protein